MATLASNSGLNTDALSRRFDDTRALSLALAAPLSDADASAQSMPDASPAKWHLAHSSWFFEAFILRGMPGYRVFDDRFFYLFNSYYEAEGPRHTRAARGLLTRPSLADVVAYRRHVDTALMERLSLMNAEMLDLVELGIHHEQQHQELLLTDILHLFSCNPLEPALYPPRSRPDVGDPGPITWIERAEAIAEIGHDGGGFAFDCEGPRHRVVLERHALADRLVTNAEWQAFVDDGGYRRPEHWLSDGWAWVRKEAIDGPLYWRGAKGWDRFGFDGARANDPAAPVRHISYFEADAYASWAGARLPTEAEWEAAAAGIDPAQGNFLDRPGPVRPVPVGAGSGLRQMFGDVWEWTRSAYLPYPGFRPAAGAVDEYNGKFMSGQFVLKGGSCATPRGHVRASYRNFFYPHQRWQFTGLRLARDL